MTFVHYFFKPIDKIFYHSTVHKKYEFASSLLSCYGNYRSSAVWRTMRLEDSKR